MKSKKRVSKKRRILNLILLGMLPIFFYSCVDSMIFHPPECSYRRSTSLINIPTEDGRTIAAYYYPPASDGSFVILFSHGNAEDIGHLRGFVQQYHLQDFGILAYDYGGYGLSEGKPSEQSTYYDIEAAYQYLTEHAHIDPSRIIIHGRSVGSGPSVWLAERYPAAGLILESPFVSVYRVMTRWPIIPFDKYNNLARIENVRCPLLVIHGDSDKEINIRHGQKLYEAAHEPKMCYWVGGAGHNNLVDTAGQNYWDTLDAFRETVIQFDKEHGTTDVK